MHSAGGARLGRMAQRWPMRLAWPALLCALLSFARGTLGDGLHPRGWLGIAMAPASVGPGVKVEHVVHGSPAEKAGLRPDDQITLVDGVLVATSRDVIHALSLHGVGETVSVTITRSGKAQPLNVVLAEFPTSDTMLRMDHVGSPAPAWDGRCCFAGCRCACMRG